MKKLLTILILFLTFNIYSQNTTKDGTWIFHIGGVFPSADFSDDDLDNDDSLGAGVGLGINFEYLYPINENGLNLFFGLGFNYNGLKNDWKDEIEDIYEANGLDGDVNFGNIFTAPVSGGLNYTYEIDDNLALFGNFGLVYNFLYYTDVTYEDSNFESTESSGLAGNLGFKFGGGIRLKNKTYISLHLLNAGQTEIEREIEVRGNDISEDDSFEFEPNIQYLTLTIGFRL